MEQEQERYYHHFRCDYRILVWYGYSMSRIASTSSTPRTLTSQIEVERSMRALDGAVMVYWCSWWCSSRSLKPYGVRQTNIKFRVLRLLTKWDRMGANFLKVVNQIKAVWARTRFRCSWRLVLNISPVLLTW